MKILAQLPKIELHLHLDCSLSYEVVARIDPAVTEEAYLRDFIAPSKCIHLADFLTRAVKGIALMQTAEQLRWVVEDLFRQMAADNMLYAELRFAPLQHLEKGMTAYEVVAAAETAVSDSIKATGIEARLILCTLRHYTAAQSMQTVHLVEQFANSCVAGFDIAADEAGFPVTNHIAAFAYAREKGIHCTAHAGEAKGPESVWETLQYFGPSRIGHGVRSAEDPALLAHLRANKIHLEICPTCNVLIDIYKEYTDHPIDVIYKSGVSVGINTDTRTITNVSLNQEYEKLQHYFGWTLRDFYTCNQYALEAAFIPAAIKASLQQKLDNAWLPAIAAGNSASL
jgi:adenosine deaminase